MKKMMYRIQSISDGKIYAVSPENISGSYTSNGKEMVSFSRGHVVDEGVIIQSFDPNTFAYLPPSTTGVNNGSVNKGILAAAALGLGALLLLV